MSDTLPAHIMDWPSAGLVAALFFLAVGALAANRMRAKIRHLTAAVNHMSQGLCMFDASARIVVCNQQYLRMYKLSPKVVKPGCTLLELTKHRKATGLFTGDPEQYCQEILNSIAAGKTSKWTIETSDGRTLHAVNERMPHGGWVATHEDITEQKLLQKQHDDMAQQQSRRGAVDAVVVAFDVTAGDEHPPAGIDVHPVGTWNIMLGADA